MLERDHEHVLRPFAVNELPNGSQAIQSRCAAGCGLEEKRIVYEGVVIKLNYRYGGLWFDAIDLIRLGRSLEIVECDECGGDPGLVVCDKCAGALVLGTDLERLEMPNLRVH